MDPISLVIGGLGRILPEVIGLFTAKQQAAAAAQRSEHERLMYGIQATHELELAKVQEEKSKIEDEQQWRQAVATAQTPLVSSGNRFLDVVNAVNALFRPVVAFWYFGIFAMIRTAQLLFTVWAAVDGAIDANDVEWYKIFEVGTEALAAVWTTADANLLASILSYWFLDRTIEKMKA